MREWLSGGAPPCQGGGRGFDPRLALEQKRDIQSDISFFVRARDGSESPRRAHYNTLTFTSLYCALRGDDARIYEQGTCMYRATARDN